MSNCINLVLVNQAPQTEWNNITRRTVWFIMTKAKKFLQIDVCPTIAKAFIILHTYFREYPNNDYSLFTLVCASLTFSCKISRTIRTIKDVFRSILWVCLSIASKPIKDFINGVKYTNDYQPYADEIEAIKNAEVMLMNALGFDTDIELPFVYVDKWENCIKSTIPNEKRNAFVQQVKLDCCLVICSEYCLDVPAEVCAAAAFNEAMDTQSTPHNAEMENYVKAKYGDSSYDLAINSIRLEMSRTAQPPRRKQQIKHS